MPNYNFLIIPAAVAFLVSAVIVIGKKRLLKAQGTMAFSLVLSGITLLFYRQWLATDSMALFFYEYAYTVLALLCPPAFYAAICAFTSPRGLTRRCRAIFIPSLLYIAILSIKIAIIGANAYALECCQWRHAAIGHMEGPMTTMDFLNGNAYSIMVGLLGLYVMVSSLKKMKEFRIRFNTHYADRFNKRHLAPYLPVMALCVLVPLVPIMVMIGYYRPETWMLAIVSLVLSAVFMLLGNVTFALPYTAEELNNMVDNPEA